MEAATAQPETRMLAPKEVADRYHVHRRKVWQWINDGRLFAIDVAKGKGRPTWRIPPGALSEFDRQRQNVPEPTHRRRNRLVAGQDEVIEFIR